MTPGLSTVTRLPPRAPAPALRLLIVTREDPDLPLARYRARGQLPSCAPPTSVFLPDEAAEFLGRVMGLDLSAEDMPPWKLD